MKIISWNVNGIRSCVQKGFLDYLHIENPDIIGLQEVKATEEQNPISLDLTGLGYHIFWNSAQKKGYSGTAVFTKIAPKHVFYGLDHAKDAEGRVLVLEFETFFLVNVYTPNAKSELERLDHRIQWDRDFLARMRELQQKKPVIFMGDLNVAHREIDLTNPKSNRGNAGFTDEERVGFDHMIEAGFVDTFRALYPELTGAYSWWSNFFQSRARNIGWRIDYVMIAKTLTSKLEAAFIRQEVHGSDHCPVGIIIDTK